MFSEGVCERLIAQQNGSLKSAIAWLRVGSFTLSNCLQVVFVETHWYANNTKFIWVHHTPTIMLQNMQMIVWIIRQNKTIYSACSSLICHSIQEADFLNAPFFCLERSAATVKFMACEEPEIVSFEKYWSTSKSILWTWTWLKPYTTFVKKKKEIQASNEFLWKYQTDTVLIYSCALWLPPPLSVVLIPSVPIGVIDFFL